MPRSGINGTYSLPPNTNNQAPNTPISSSMFNAFASDVQQTFNDPTPVAYGGTGAATAAAAATALEVVSYAAQTIAPAQQGQARANIDALGPNETADRAFRRGNILGTVSQSGGVPTGSIIERGSNTNGEYVRFADGTQIVTMHRPFTDTGFYSVTLPAEFVNVDYRVSAISVSSGSNIPIVGKVNGKTVSSVTMAAASAIGGGTAFANVNMDISIIGRWF